ncbi:MAG: Ca-activated chloride channel family protein [Pirellulaceae bacterium]|jgi:Ca-activated chloride channel family protein
MPQYFDYPWLLLSIWLLPVVGFLLWRAHRRRIMSALQFANSAMIGKLVPTPSGWRELFRGACLLIAMALLIVAASSPRFGERIEEVETHGTDVMVLLDVSKSMLARDVAPSRLQRAKSDIRDLLGRLKSDRVGLIAFAGAPVVQVPLTHDQGFYETMLQEVSPASAPRGGSLIGDAIRKALEVMQPLADRDQVLIIITDGEDHDSYPDQAAQQAAERNVKIIAVGIGDEIEGQRIPIRDESGNAKFVEHDGKVIWSKLDGALLKRIAIATGGAYIPAKTRNYDLGQIYDDHLSDLTRTELRKEKQVRRQHQYQWFTAFALGLLLLQSWYPRYPRKPESAD